MIFASMPIRATDDKPAVMVDRLRSFWKTPGAYLILEGVHVAFVKAESVDASDSPQEEHFLFALDGELEELDRLNEIIAAHAFPAPAIWTQSNVIRSVNDAGEFYLRQHDKLTGGLIHQRMSFAMPDSHVVLSNAGRFFLKAEMTSEAAGYLERAYRLAPHVPEVAVNFMVLRQLEEKWDEVDEVRSKLVSDHADHPLVRALGLVDPRGDQSDGNDEQ